MEITPDSSEKISQADIIYFGTLVQRTMKKSYQTLHDLLALRKPSSRTLCDINLRPGCYSKKTILETLNVTDILKLNREECRHISSCFSGPDNETDILYWLMDKFNIDMISLTADSDGSRLITKEGSYHISGEKPPVIRDTVGAGDAYAAVLAGGLLNNWPPEKILKTASRFAGRICGLKGALPSNNGFYDEIIKEFRK